MELHTFFCRFPKRNGVSPFPKLFCSHMKRMFFFHRTAEGQGLYMRHISLNHRKCEDREFPGIFLTLPFMEMKITDCGRYLDKKIRSVNGNFGSKYVLRFVSTKPGLNGQFGAKVPHSFQPSNPSHPSRPEAPIFVSAMVKFCVMLIVMP